MSKENLSIGNGANVEATTNCQAEVKSQTSESPRIISIAVLDDKTDTHGPMKAWIENSSCLCLRCWRAVRLAAAREVAASRPDVVLVESRLSGDRGVQCAYLLKHLCPQLTVVLFTDVPDLSTCIRCYQVGADGYVSLLTRLFFEETLREALLGFKPFPREIGKVIAEHWEKRFVLPGGGLLTQGQAAVMAALLKGKLDKEIASDRGTTEGTVHAILHSIYTKIGARSRTQAVARFLPLGEAFTIARRVDHVKRAGGHDHKQL